MWIVGFPDASDRQAVTVDEDLVARFQCCLATEPLAGVVQPFGGDGVDALARGGKAKIGAVGDQGGKQRTVMILGTGPVASGP